jgi:predicted nucleic acid-binding protein
VTTFADSSALVKLYADEEGRDVVLGAEPLAISQLARVEVPSALWRKQRLGEISADWVATLTREFEADYFGTRTGQPRRFSPVDARVEVLDQAAQNCARHGLRAYDAVQLACATATRRADPRCGSFVAFDRALRTAAATEGFAVVPL